jgi:ABC-2 type transport system permease protein
MAKWQLLKLKPVLPLILVVQTLVGIGTVIGMGFLYPEIDPASAAFLVTGGPTLTLIALGLVFVPQMVSNAKAEGSFDYLYALPVPRMAYLAADLTIWLVAVLPSVVLALVVGAVRYDIDFRVSPLVVPAFILIVLMATMTGYAIVHLTPTAELVTVITNFIVFCLFLFSPINFPSERLPDWLARVHDFLPVKYSADLVRATLAGMHTDRIPLAFLVLALWCLAAFAITFLAMTRRR